MLKKYFVIAIISCLLMFTQGLDVQKIKTLLASPKSKWSDISQLLANGDYRGFIHLQEAYSLFDELVLQYPQICNQKQPIGKSYEERDIQVYSMSSITENLNEQNGIFINGVQHAREAMSLSIVVYTYVNYIFKYVKQEQETIDLLQNSVIWFVPVVNVDQYEFNYQYFLEHGKFSMLRKNRHVLEEQEKCNGVIEGMERGGLVSKGIDLNRNYPYKFGYDDEGSDSNVCSDAYRGKYPFSEPETQAMKHFLDSKKNIKIAFNFHAYGPLWIMPYNYKKDKTNPDIPKLSTTYNVYQMYKEYDNFPNHNVFGNAYQTVNYPANGELTDWMLHDYGIYALSVEVGGSKNYNHKNPFYVQQKYIEETLNDSYPAVEFFMQKVMFDPQLDLIMILGYHNMEDFLKNVYPIRDQKDIEDHRILTFELFNQGLGDMITDEDLNEIILEIDFVEDLDFDTSDFVQKIYLEEYSEDEFLQLQDPKIDTEEYQRFINYTIIKEIEFEQTKVDPEEDIIFYRIPLENNFNSRTYKKYHLVLHNKEYNIHEQELTINITIDTVSKQAEFKSIPINTQSIDELKRTYEYKIIGEVPKHVLNKIVEVFIICIILGFIIYMGYNKYREYQHRKTIKQLTQDDETDHDQTDNVVQQDHTYDSVD